MFRLNVPRLIQRASSVSPNHAGSSATLGTATLVIPSSSSSTSSTTGKKGEEEEDGGDRIQLPADVAAVEAAKYIMKVLDSSSTTSSSTISGNNRRKKPFTVITGAGCSTESGIPDYRSKNGLYQKVGFKPLTADQFRKDASRRRYWARSFLGFHAMGHSTHNAVHEAIHRLLSSGVASHLVTQNVDGLHHYAAHDHKTTKNPSSEQKKKKNEVVVVGAARNNSFFSSLQTAADFGTSVSSFSFGGGDGSSSTTTLHNHHKQRYDLCTQSPLSFGCSTSSSSSSPKLVELHGNIHQVLCTGCGDVTSRYELQGKLADLNNKLISDILERHPDKNKSDFVAEQISIDVPNNKRGGKKPELGIVVNPHVAQQEGGGTREVQQEEKGEASSTSLVRPDGDFDAPEHFAARFQIPDCPKCGSHLKPHVVMFGENVNKEKVDEVFNAVENSAALFCIGTSLTVWSSYRFVDRAKKLGIPVFILNDGPTRGDAVCDLKIDEMQLGEVLPKMVDELLARY